MDSCCALPINEQVFTTMTSASSALGVSSAPAWASMPIITSLSTRFLGQPRLTKPTFEGGAGAIGSEMIFLVDTRKRAAGKPDLLILASPAGSTRGQGWRESLGNRVGRHHKGNFRLSLVRTARA